MYRQISRLEALGPRIALCDPDENLETASMPALVQLASHIPAGCFDATRNPHCIDVASDLRTYSAKPLHYQKLIQEANSAQRDLTKLSNTVADYAGINSLWHIPTVVNAFTLYLVKSQKPLPDPLDTEVIKHRQQELHGYQYLAISATMFIISDHLRRLNPIQSIRPSQRDLYLATQQYILTDADKLLATLESMICQWEAATSL